MKHTDTILQLVDLSVKYGKAVEALKGVSFSIKQAEILAILGQNGAGKSTVLKAITGLLDIHDGRIIEGDILFLGQSIKGQKPHQLVHCGISLVPERRHVFSNLTVEDNLILGGFTLRQEVNLAMDKVYSLFPVLIERRKQKAGTLSAGEQQMLVLGRALMQSPKLLLLDEPTLGLSPNFLDTVINKIIEINSEGVSVVIVEQNIEAAIECSNRILFLQNGKIRFSGISSEFDPESVDNPPCI